MVSVDRRIAVRIRGKRRALGLEQIDLAKALGVEPDVIEAYEQATMRVSPERLIKLSALLEVPVSFFFETKFRVETTLHPPAQMPAGGPKEVEGHICLAD